MRVELEETLVDSMLSEEKEDEEIDGGDVGSDNDTVILLKPELFPQTSQQATSY